MPSMGSYTSKSFNAHMWKSCDVRWCSLDHGDVLRLIGDAGQDGDGRGSGADHGHLGALDELVALLGPDLRVDNLPPEVVLARQVWSEGILVAVVAHAAQQEAAAVLLAGGGGEVPSLVRGGELGRGDVSVELDQVSQALLLHSLVQVGQDGLG